MQWNRYNFKAIATVFTKIGSQDKSFTTIDIVLTVLSDYDNDKTMCDNTMQMQWLKYLQFIQ